jgi:hypothetical protein
MGWVDEHCKFVDVQWYIKWWRQKQSEYWDGLADALAQSAQSRKAKAGRIRGRRGEKSEQRRRINQDPPSGLRDIHGSNDDNIAATVEEEYGGSKNPQAHLRELSISSAENKEIKGPG